MAGLPDPQSDYMKKWKKAKQTITQPYDLMEYLIMASATSGRDRAFLLDQEPLFIVRNFIGQSINGT